LDDERVAAGVDVVQPTIRGVMLLPGSLTMYCRPLSGSIAGDAGSKSTLPPVVGSNRRFCWAVLVTRIRSIAGLKSNPNDARSVNGIVEALPTAVAAALAVLMV
jgi:hypothetical protein